MQNASGLWGKVKSQAQQAGSMAQGAINVSYTPLWLHQLRAEYLEWRTEGYNRWTGVYAVFLSSWRISESGQDLTAFPRLVLGDIRDEELIDSQSKPAELGSKLHSQGRTTKGEG